MPDAPPDWYADPYHPGQPVQRYWDGTRWTEHVHQGWPQAAQPGQAGQAGQAGQVRVVASGKTTTTPDGQVLAGWGARFGAYVLDAICTSVLSLLIGFPLLHRVISVYVDFIHETVDADQAGRTPPDAFDIYGRIWKPGLGLAAIAIVVVLVFHVGFLRWRAATPGKILLGLQVRQREHAGPLPMGVVLRRVLGQYGPSVLGIVPFVGTLASLYALLDDLWPLWDDKRQAIHDKWADTFVVRRR